MNNTNIAAARNSEVWPDIDILWGARGHAIYRMWNNTWVEAAWSLYLTFSFMALTNEPLKSDIWKKIIEIHSKLFYKLGVELFYTWKVPNMADAWKF
jgi:hypothetical protein